jgi:aminobenzoyl-glutamate transport protein
MTSSLLSGVAFAQIDPRSGEPIRVNNLLTGPGMVTFLSTWVTTITYG